MSLDNVCQAFESMAGMLVRFDLILDEDGYLDHKCAREECGQFFKSLWEDLDSDKRDIKGLYCPMCRHTSQVLDFSTPVQVEYLNEVVVNAAREHLKQTVQLSPQRYRGRRHQGMVSIRWDFKVAPVEIPVSPLAEDVLTLRATCEQCQFRYAVVGAAYFCPACGHNSVKQTLKQTIRGTRDAVEMLPQIKAAIGDRDKAAYYERRMIESQLGTLVMAFQRFAESLYPQLPNPALKLRRNVFQNLVDGSDIWESAGGKAYSNVLSESEMTEIAQLFQKRHLLAHTDGVIDETYIERSGDTSYAVGQRLSFRESDVLRLAYLVESLTDSMLRQVHR